MTAMTKFKTIWSDDGGNSSFNPLEWTPAYRIFSSTNKPLLGLKCSAVLYESLIPFIGPFCTATVIMLQGACTTLLSVRVYYIACPSVITNLAVFNETPAGPDMTSIVQRDGQCVQHAVQLQQPSYLCKADGNWYYNTGRCHCSPGYQRRTDETVPHCAGNLFSNSVAASVPNTLVIVLCL